MSGKNSLVTETAELSATATRELGRLFERLRRSEPGSQSRAAAVVYLTEIISQYTRPDNVEARGGCGNVSKP